MQLPVDRRALAGSRYKLADTIHRDSIAAEPKPDRFIVVGRVVLHKLLCRLRGRQHSAPGRLSQRGRLKTEKASGAQFNDMEVAP